jgi:hypothetical protein
LELSPFILNMCPYNLSLLFVGYSFKVFNFKFFNFLISCSISYMVLSAGL